jgi:hypothetical protein
MQVGLDAVLTGFTIPAPLHVHACHNIQRLFGPPPLAQQQATWSLLNIHMSCLG